MSSEDQQKPPSINNSPEVHLDDDDNKSMTESEIEKWYSTAYERGSKTPMKDPLVSSLDLSISSSDMEKLKIGFKARSMDDRWDILVQDPDEKDGVSIHILRSWGQEECYVLHIGGEGGKINSITWEGNKAGLRCEADQALKEAVIVCRARLDCEFENLPSYPSSVLWDPQAYRKVE
ncbi:hypothetical protein GGS20DRAFT_126925 [Poronia punctata]|nr:hypothetical protein GGS20DRAFT_126925 [Poronia punctata]